MSEIKDLINSVALTDVLSQPTKERPEGNFQESQEKEFGFSFDKEHFSDEPEPIETAPVPEPEPEEPYDAEAEAKKLVGLLNAGNTLVLSPIGNLKLRKNRGGKAAFEKMKVAYEKKNQGKKLSEDEQSLCDQFDSYKTDMRLLNGEIPFSQAQIDTLITAAIPYCESRKLKVNSDFAFWGIYGGVQIEKITKILMA